MVFGIRRVAVSVVASAVVEERMVTLESRING
jgi:hypothetical protein